MEIAMDKKSEIHVGDIVEITTGLRYPPKHPDSIGIVIDEMPTTDGFDPVYIVMWDGHVDGLPTRRLKKIEKIEHAGTKDTLTELN
jgi:hypothetical protein